MKASVQNKVVLGFAMSLFALAVLGWLSYRTTENLIATQALVSHTHEVIATLELGLALLTDAETSQRGFLLTGDERFLIDCQAAQSKIGGWLEKIRQLTRDNSRQQQRLAALESLITQRLAVLNSRIKLRQEQGLQAAADAVALRQGKDLMLQVWESISEMRAEEDRLLADRQQAADLGAKSSILAIETGSILAGGLGLMAVLKIRRDLKLREQSEALLKHERYLLKELMDNAEEDIYFKDRDGRFLRINRHHATRFGLGDPALAVGKTDFDFFTPEHAQQARDDEQTVMRSGRPFIQEEKETWPDGRETWAATIKLPLRDAAGNVAGTFGLSRDITASRRSQEELDRFFALSLDFLCIASADGYFKRISPAVTDILGWSVGEFLARPFIEFVHPDDRDATRREVEKQVHAGEKVLRFENRYQHKDGSWRVLSWRSIPQPGGLMYATARDVTEQKAAEAELRRSRAVFENLFVSLPGLYLVLTPELKIAAVSDAYLKATMTRRAEITGRGLFEIFPDNPGDPKATGTSNLRTSLNRVLKNAEPDTMAIQKYDVRRPDGVFEERFWSPVNSPVLGANREIEYIIHRVEDVTDFVRQKQPPAANDAELRVRMEQMQAEIFLSSQKVQAANQQLEAVNKELEAFSYSVSHDLRAPLRHIDGFAEMMQQTATTLDDSGKRYLSIISDAAKRMGALIDDLLVFSRMGRSEMRRSTVNLDELVAETRTELGRDLNGRNIQWEISSLPEVDGDRPMLKQVWVNLIANAVKYTGQRERAEIKIRCRQNPAGELEFSVADNGAGFDMQYAHKLFGVFQRLHLNEEFEGTGIGLANVRRIILRHGGKTWAEGKVDAGATFYFTLPAANHNGNTHDNIKTHTLG
jgi:PAS domain S-box-containing protein